MSAATLERKFTYADYKALDVDDNFLYELLNGELVKKSAPSPQHQTTVLNLAFAIKAFIQEKKLGKVFVAPIDVFLDEENIPQPDLVFVSDARLNIVTKDGIMGVPDLVAEVISPSSLRRDRYDKKKLYQQYQIPEYWLIDPQNQSVEVYVFHENDYDIFSFEAVNGMVQSKIIEGFSVDLGLVF